MLLLLLRLAQLLVYITIVLSGITVAVAVSAFVYVLFEGRHTPTGDFLDRTVILSVTRSDDGRLAAVTYLHEHADSSGAFIRTAIQETTTDAIIGGALRQRPRDVIAIEANESTFHTIGQSNLPAMQQRARELLSLRWLGDRRLAVCPSSEARLRLFRSDTDLGLWDTALLCPVQAR